MKEVEVEQFDDEKSYTYIFKILLAIIVLIIAASRVIWFDRFGAQIDQTFITLIILSLIIVYVPWKKLEKLSLPGVGEFTFTPDSPEINNLLNKSTIDESKRIENLEIKRLLHQKAETMKKVQGSRILWIDDDPRKLFEERRLFRALNIETEIM